eukprot:356981-Chlamydomonas_euryale.AAC.1
MQAFFMHTFIHACTLGCAGAGAKKGETVGGDDGRPAGLRQDDHMYKVGAAARVHAHGCACVRRHTHALYVQVEHVEHVRRGRPRIPPPQAPHSHTCCA